MGWWNWESQNWGLLGTRGKITSSRSHAVTPGRLNYNHHAGGRVKTLSSCSPGLHGKTRVAPAHEGAWLLIPKQDAGTWGMKPISGHCLFWGRSVGSLKPASHPELTPALLLLWLAQTVLCPAWGSIALVSAGTGLPSLQTGMGHSAWKHPHHSPYMSPGPSLATFKGKDHSQAAGELEGHRHCHGLGALPSPMAAGDAFASPPVPLVSLEPLAGCKPPFVKRGRDPSLTALGGRGINLHQPGDAGRDEDPAPPLPKRQDGKYEAGPTLLPAPCLTGKPKTKLLTELPLLARCGCLLPRLSGRAEPSWPQQVSAGATGARSRAAACKKPRWVEPCVGMSECCGSYSSAHGGFWEPGTDGDHHIHSPALRKGESHPTRQMFIPPIPLWRFLRDFPAPTGDKLRCLACLTIHPASRLAPAGLSWFH